MSFECIELQTARPASEVFRIEQHVAEVDYRERMDTFLSAMSQTKVETTSVEGVIEVVRGMGLAPTEVALATEVLFAAASGEIK